jgi:hypothetical protein
MQLNDAASTSFLIVVDVDVVELIQIAAANRRKSPQIAAPQKIYDISCNTGIVPSMTSIGVM